MDFTWTDNFLNFAWTGLDWTRFFGAWTGLDLDSKKLVHASLWYGPDDMDRER